MSEALVRLHASVWASLMRRKDQMPHALLLSGQLGIGKHQLAELLASALLCEQPRMDGLPCGACLACGWQAQGHHPDFRRVQPEAMMDETGEKENRKKAVQQITIEQLRSLDTFLSVGTHRGGKKIILIHPAEAMNRNAANSLLKVLEEPSVNTLFLIVSHEPMRLLPTIRSRCQMVHVPLPDQGISRSFLIEQGIEHPEDWLALAAGAPFMALALAGAEDRRLLETLATILLDGADLDVLQASSQIEKCLREVPSVRLPHVVAWMEKWLVDAVLIINQLPARYFVRHTATMQKLLDRLPPVRFIRFYRHLIERRVQAEQPLNVRLFLEDLFLNYRALFAR